MSEIKYIPCPICETQIPDVTYEPCPCCEWVYVGIEHILDPNKQEPFNLMSVSEAKKLFKQGFTKWKTPIRN